MGDINPTMNMNAMLSSTEALNILQIALIATESHAARWVQAQNIQHIANGTCFVNAGL